VNEETHVGRRLRDIMGRFPTGVTVVASLDAQGAAFGLTVNSFTSVSLDPPLVLVCIDGGAASYRSLMVAQHFAVSVLASDQAGVADRFASGPSEGRFEDVRWHGAGYGSPVLDGAVAWLECSRHEVFAAGDHSILLGRVESVGGEDRPALLFHRGRYGSAGS
jgi:flavin reductase (DIM6/NTAB) family NADH-FMN oxidoreductase RutF